MRGEDLKDFHVLPGATVLRGQVYDALDSRRQWVLRLASAGSALRKPLGLLGAGGQVINMKAFLAQAEAAPLPIPPSPAIFWSSSHCCRPLVSTSPAAPQSVHGQFQRSGRLVQRRLAVSWSRMRSITTPPSEHLARIK